MIDYLIDSKSIFDSFATTDFPISNANFVEYVVDDLGLEYPFFITSLHFQPSTTFD